MAIRVAIAEDQRLMREALGALLPVVKLVTSWNGAALARGLSCPVPGETLFLVEARGCADA